MEKSAISLIYGIGVTTLVIYYISYFVGLNSISIVLGSFFSLVASVMMSHIFYNETSFGCKIDARKYICDIIKKIFTATKRIILGFRYMNKLEYLSFFIIFCVFIFISVISYNTVLNTDGNGNYTSAGTTWGDLPFHLALITSFAYGDNFPPVYPIFPEKKLSYPFMFDFLSSILLKLGFSLKMSVFLPNTIFYAVIIILLYSFTLRISKSYVLSIISILLLFFSGGFQFMYYMCPETFQKFYNTPNLFVSCPFEFFSSISNIYPDLYKFPSYEIKDKYGFDFLNITWGFLLPQRTFIFGIALFLSIVLCLYTVKKDMIPVIIILYTILPWYHMHTFLATTIVFVMFYSFFKGTRFSPVRVIILIFFILLFMSPVIYGTFNIISNNGFMKIKPIWSFDYRKNTLRVGDRLYLRVFDNRDIFISYCRGHDCCEPERCIKKWFANGDFAIILRFLYASILYLGFFWWKNLGFFIILSIYGFSLLKPYKNYLKLYISGILLFIISNIIQLQPWEFDNSKLLVLSYILFIPSSVIAMRKKSFLILFIIPGLISGIIPLIPLLSQKFVLFNHEEIQAAEFIINNLPKNAVILSAPVHNNPVVSLAGRKTPMGFEGWLWSHGVDYHSKKQELWDMFDLRCDILRKYNISYIYISGKEKKYIGKRLINPGDIIYRSKNIMIYRLYCR